jgi:hypothetical protein
VKRASVIISSIVALAVPVPASAAGGWVLPQATGVHGSRTNTSFGRHCGLSKFGVWNMIGTSTINGVQGRWTFKLSITQDGALHPARDVRFSSYTRTQDRRLVHSVFTQTRYHYAVVNGVALLQGIWHGGKQQAAQAFNPQPGRCR